VALSTVVLPQLSREHAAQSSEEYAKTLRWALRCVWLIGLPCAVGLILLSGPILATLIYHGDFNAFDVIMTRKSLMAFALGLPAFMWVKVLASAFYAQQNIKTPVKIAAIALCVNVVLNVLLIHSLAHAGLALSSSIASIVNAGLLYWFISRQLHQATEKKIVWRVVLAVMVMAGGLFFMIPHLQTWLHWDEFTRLWHLLLALLIGGASYFLSLSIFGVRLQDIKTA